MKNKILILTILTLCVLLCSCGKSEAIIAAENAIYAIGNVTLNSGPAIEKAEKAIEALSDEDKEKFEQYDRLEEIKNQYKQLKEEEKENTLKELKNKIQGYWIIGYHEFIGFENNKVFSGAYPGNLDTTGEIKDIRLEGENRLNISIYYPESMEWDEVVPAYTEIINVDVDTYEKIYITNKRGKKEYRYAGKTFEELKISIDNSNKLPELSNFKSLMNNAINDYYREVGINAVNKGYLIKNYEVIDMKGKEATYEYAILGTYGPNNSINMTGTANSGKVEYIHTFVPIIGMKLDGEGLASVATMTMVSAKLFDKKYYDFESIYNLMENLIQHGKRDKEGTACTLVINEIEYTLTVSDNKIGFTVNARK